MPFSCMYSQLFNTSCKIQRRTLTRNNIGDYTQVLNTILDNIPAVVQSLGDKERRYEYYQGKEYTIKASAYIPDNLEITPVDGDFLYDNNTAILYQIISVSRFKAANSSISANHHIKLLLYIPQGEKS